ncbi:MAG: hypothetical protein JRI68_33470 [Deltaproteobacteria bacterium]|nr:hypothetical protein [Deltaproteobacteria bacterium]
MSLGPDTDLWKVEYNRCQVHQQQHVEPVPAVTESCRSLVHQVQCRDGSRRRITEQTREDRIVCRQ